MRSRWMPRAVSRRTDFAAALAKKPALVSVMLANNETGVLQDIPALALQARTAKAWFHTDGCRRWARSPSTSAR